MIYTEAEIEKVVSKINGTYIKRNNMRKKLTDETNNDIETQIEAIRKDIRLRKLNGEKEQDVRGLYAEITKLEIQRL